MATLSLYRRYRPRRFSELKGQDHVVRALRDAVAGGREGQAYLFSGPRGTGKTSSARILAKVLNCQRPVDGEPCCECESCLAVERGTSFDVHELDAASNNGVDNMRELIERASLGTPGRHKVYILDEVHMLSRPAEAALLKTLEEPPPHVVFVLATTDPQKVNDTIRSRTQHLRFHLLPPDELAEHVRWVASDAGLDVDDASIDAALAQGGGSARDTLSALELLANAGSGAADTVSYDEFLDALIDHDAGQALTAMANAVNAGHEPRAIADALVRHLRDGFLSLMAPELVQFAAHRVDELAARAQRLGPAALVRAIERLGEILVELRHAPDARVLVEVALVQLTTPPAADHDDVGALAARVSRLEQELAAGRPPPAAPVDPATGRTALGGRARRPAASPPGPAGPAGVGAEASTAAPTTPSPGQAAAAAAAGHPSAGGPDPGRDEWDRVRPTLGGITRALFASVDFVDAGAGTVTLAAPNAAHLTKCQQHVAAVEQAFVALAGRPVSIQLVVGDAVAPARVRAAPASGRRPAGSDRAPGDPGGSDDSDEPDVVDLDDLVDAGPEPSALDRLAEAFPGAELVERGE